MSGPIPALTPVDGSTAGTEGLGMQTSAALAGLALETLRWAHAGSVDSAAEAPEAALARRDRQEEKGMLAREAPERRVRAATCHEAHARWTRAFLASEHTA